MMLWGAKPLRASQCGLWVWGSFVLPEFGKKRETEQGKEKSKGWLIK